MFGWGKEVNLAHGVLVGCGVLYFLVGLTRYLRYISFLFGRAKVVKTFPLRPNED